MRFTRSIIMPTTARNDIFLSVVVTTFNRGELLADCLAGFTRQSLPRDRFEVVVVDDGSAEPSDDIVRPFQDTLDIKYIYQKNSGLAAARNSGIAATIGSIIVPFDDDNSPHEQCLQEHYRFHLSYPALEEGMLAFMEWAPGLEVTPLMHYVTEVSPMLWCYKGLRSGQELPFGYLWGGCSSYKKELIRRAGGFDARFRFGYEDTEAELRMRRCGLTIRFHPAAVCHALASTTYEGFCGRVRQQGRSLYRFAAMYPDDPIVQNYTAISAPEDIVAKYEPLLPQIETLMPVLLQRKWSLPETSSDPSIPSLALLYESFFISFSYWKNRGIVEAASQTDT